ncbi:O-acetylhomoserine aminocarboxypropyltransferase/cysteine synthase family protein [Treponema sp.]|uniref:O-acetylhomoserine aminocarboxypropyltransferase/cysteine synthase family protein n=1 Tax=Treponema sp. TaxID=166 RepID=UPI003FA21E56
MRIETECLHAGYTPKNGEPRVVPIVQSTTYCFDSTEHIADLFNMPSEHMYSRLSNPTCDAVEQKLATLEGGVGAMLTSSGQAASLTALLNVCSAGDSIISTGTIYGGTVNLFAVTLKKMGIECIWIDGDAPAEKIQAAFKPNTKAVFCETIANPALAVCDIEKLSAVAHKNHVPLIIDNTFATPFLCRPIQWGADIVVHSTTKYLDGHALQVGGVIVDSGKFDWEAAHKASGKFPDLVNPDASYHGLIYTKDFGNKAYIVKARMHLMRDIGCCTSAHAAFLLNLGLETLPLRMERYCKNALEVARFFKSSDKIESVRYPGLEGDRYYEAAKKYLPLGASGVISITVKGGRQGAVRFMDGLKLASNVVHVADIRTSVLHPASATHRQLTDEQLKAAGIDGGLVRFSCGLEHIDDILDDIKGALQKV